MSYNYGTPAQAGQQHAGSYAYGYGDATSNSASTPSYQAQLQQVAQQQFAHQYQGQQQQAPQQQQQQHYQQYTQGGGGYAQTGAYGGQGPRVPGQGYASCSNPADRPNNYKSRMCKNFDETGTCIRGATCNFAHGQHEIRAIGSMPPAAAAYGQGQGAGAGVYGQGQGAGAYGQGGGSFGGGGGSFGGQGGGMGGAGGALGGGAPGSMSNDGGFSRLKTKICSKWASGTCTFNERCSYAHGDHELRAIGGGGMNPADHPDKHRTKACKRFSTTGECYLGDRCTFLHAGVVQPPISMPSIAPPPPTATGLSDKYSYGTDEPPAKRNFQQPPSAGYAATVSGGGDVVTAPGVIGGAPGVVDGAPGVGAASSVVVVATPPTTEAEQK